MKNIRKQANITRYIQIASRGLSPLRPVFAKLSIVSKKHIFSTSQFTGGGEMKKLFVFLCVAGLIAASASPLFAGGIENKHNWSAEWVRSLNRNAATDSADAVAYNPAGVMKMDGGFYLNVAGQYALKEYSNTYQGTKRAASAFCSVSRVVNVFDATINRVRSASSNDNAATRPVA